MIARKATRRTPTYREASRKLTGRKAPTSGSTAGLAPDVAAHLDKIATAYRTAREDARRRSSWRLRYRERRWRRRLADRGAAGLDEVDRARLTALRAELQARSLTEVPPWPGLP